MATNYSIGLDLQGLVKKVYKTLQYESSFYKMFCRLSLLNLVNQVQY